MAVCLLHKLAKILCELVNPGFSFVRIERPSISKTKLTQVIIITIIEMPERFFLGPYNFCKVTMIICYSVVFKTYRYRIHVLKIASQRLIAKEVLTSSLTFGILNYLHVGVEADQVRWPVTSQQRIETLLKNRVTPDQYHFLSRG